jgi:hypothetical protein
VVSAAILLALGLWFISDGWEALLAAEATRH